MFPLGLKLWSINENYVNEAIKLYKQGIYDFIELYAIPDSFDAYINLWKPLKIPYIIHAPHFRQGLNLAKEECFEQNMKFAAETRKFADELNAEYIIFHPGIAGNIKETVRQLTIINDSRILIENKPYYTVLGDGNICNGHSPEEIEYIMNNTGLGFCLDIGHCFCSANAKNIKPLAYLKEFINLNPTMYHLTDNDFASPIDKHLHFGEGNFDVEKILNYLPEGVKITLETNKDSKESLDDFVNDVEYIRQFNYKILTATEVDMMDVFNLSNDPVVRENSFNSTQIQLEEHKVWFLNKINDKNCKFYIFKDYKKNEILGYSRFDKTNDIDNEYVITIHLDKKYRGKGFGSSFIKTCSTRLFNENKLNKIFAYVKENNNASLKSFEKAGFKIINKDNINGYPCFKLQLNG